LRLGRDGEVAIGDLIGQLRHGAQVVDHPIERQPHGVLVG